MSIESFCGWQAEIIEYGEPIYEADGPPRIIIADATDAGVVIIRQTHPEAADGDGAAYAKDLRRRRLAKGNKDRRERKRVYDLRVHAPKG